MKARLRKQLGFAKRYVGIIIFVFMVAGLTNILAADSSSRITLKENSFVKDGKPFRFTGANAVNLVFYDDWGLDVLKAFAQAKENNISVLRLYLNWGWSKDEDIDKIIDTASQNGIYLILVFTDCCCSSDYSTEEKYLQGHAPFCNITNEESTKAFKQLIKQIIQRKNSVNNKVYRDDPTILAWEIANELEYWRFSESEACKWISGIAKYVKSLDNNHPVTIGISINNAESINKDLFKILNLPELDFLSFHFYPSLGEKALQVENAQKIDAVIKKLFSLGKPVVMAEFGFSNSVALNKKMREEPDTVDFYISNFKGYMDQAFSAGCSGVMFWGWGIPEAARVPMWWSKEDHNIADKKFCDFLKNYKIPKADERQ
ncbi:MAG: cellulase family glycosylhydrolase [Candidatus Omnitrophica bacterium]|nr:cellulase family glycosylhydrolase [Candidatus Omnitrophota bacterium]